MILLIILIACYIVLKLLFCWFKKDVFYVAKTITLIVFCFWIFFSFIIWVIDSNTNRKYFVYKETINNNRLLSSSVERVALLKEIIDFNVELRNAQVRYQRVSWAFFPISKNFAYLPLIK